MRKGLEGVLRAAGLVVALLVVSAPIEAAEIRVNIPFDFSVNDATLEAGVYHVTTVNNMLRVTGLRGGAVALPASAQAKERTQPKLVFHKYGERYILREVWTGGHSGRTLPEGRLERELASALRGGQRAALERVSIPR
ncbi:MAG TPA: hypothetical protein VII13_03230 [Vicinamibacteria bacterium]|jgi:hypothetical protein